MNRNIESVTHFHLDLPPPPSPPIIDQVSSLNIWQIIKHILVTFWACLRSMPESIFKVPVTMSLCQLLEKKRKKNWENLKTLRSFKWNDMQYLACLKLGVNTHCFGASLKAYKRVFLTFKKKQGNAAIYYWLPSPLVRKRLHFQCVFNPSLTVCASP